VNARVPVGRVTLGATHLFEEPGALERVADLAGDGSAGLLQSSRGPAPSRALTSE
jgi:hypothetical protein